MPRPLRADQEDADAVLNHLAEYEGLEHVRARCRADLLVLESGPKDDAIPHTRFRRVGPQKWQLEMPLLRGGWDRTPIRGKLLELVDAVITQFGWMLAPRS